MSTPIPSHADPAHNITPQAIEIAADTPRRIAPETPLRDTMQGALRIEIPVHDHGFVALVDVMPRLVPEGQTADSAIVQAARVSYGQGTKQINEDRGLIRYLMRHRHSTPFEMIEFKFHMAMPIFVARQWIRHRTANINEYSARYSILKDRFYTPSLDSVRKQSAANRQGGEQTFVASDPGEVRTAQEFLDYLQEVEGLYAKYLSLTEKGVSREMARIGLPVNIYTEWYWKCDLHNCLRFLSLRMDSHAQAEIRDYAQAMHDLMAPIVPLTMEAWQDYEMGSIRLSGPEIKALRDLAKGGSGALPSDNKREQSEWQAKMVNLGFEMHSPE